MQNGIIVFPFKSTVLKNDSTGGAKVLSQLGELDCQHLFVQSKIERTNLILTNNY